MKLLSKPLSMVSNMLGGILAAQAFKRVWRAVSGHEQAPEADSPEHGAREILLAALLQGAIFGVIKAAVDMTQARVYRKATAKRD